MGSDSPQHGEWCQEDLEVPCGECGEQSIQISGDHIYEKRTDLHGLKFWACPRCGAYCGSHKASGEPLGTPAGEETRRLRKLAHSFFDRLWKDKKIGMKRGQAYAWLAHRLNHPNPHIGAMGPEECRRVIELARKKIEESAR